MKNILGTSIEELRLSRSELAEVLCAIDECIDLIEREERGGKNTRRESECSGRKTGFSDGIDKIKYPIEYIAQR